MHRLIWVILLAGCASAPPPTDVSLLRNPTAAFGSQADVTAADLSGNWAVRQAVPDAWPNRVAELQFAGTGTTLQLRTERIVCRVDLCESEADTIPYAQSLPGRFLLSEGKDLTGVFSPEQLWVLWMDVDRRTVALGDPDGTFVVILDRNSAGGTDRITAARDILDWYGYDLTRLAEVPR